MKEIACLGPMDRLDHIELDQSEPIDLLNTIDPLNSRPNGLDNESIGPNELLGPTELIGPSELNAPIDCCTQWTHRIHCAH